jgi:hypothetical protein
LETVLFTWYQQARTSNIPIDGTVLREKAKRGVEEKNKEDENEEDMVLSFAVTYEALEKVRAFFYAHSVTDADRERILGLETHIFN